MIKRFDIERNAGAGYTMIAEIESLRAELRDLTAQCEADAVDRSKLVDEMNDLKEQLEYQKKQCANQVYRGNSICYIYDKMVCYKKQVGELADELHKLKIAAGISILEGNNDMLRGRNLEIYAIDNRRIAGVQT